MVARNDKLLSLSQFGTYRSPSAHTAKTVIHIQDVHLNAEAQENIGRAVEQLIASGKVGLIALEGAFAPINIGRFRSFNDQDALRKAARYAFSKNEISGPVHAMLTSASAVPPIIGVDDQRAHAANVDAYKKSAALISAAQRGIEARRAENDAAARRTLNPELLSLYEKSAGYRAGRLNVGAYLRQLDKSGADLPLDLQTFLEALKIEETLNFNRVEAERTQFVHYLISKLDQNAVHELEKKAASHRLGLVNQAGFYSHLMTLCRLHGISIKRFPALNEYIAYIQLSDAVNAEKLYASLREAETALFDRLTRSPREEEIIGESRRLYLSAKLADFSLTRDEWNEYKTLTPTPLPQAGEGWERIFKEFYVQAEKRDRAMTENLLREMEKTGADTAILVTGGFHAAGIAAQLKKREIGVASFVPRITRLSAESGAKNLSLFIQEKAPLEKLFEGQTLFLAPNPASLLPLPIEIVAVKSVTTPSVPAQIIIDQLLPENHGVKVEATHTNGDVNVDVSAENGRVSNVFNVSSAGAILSARVTAVKPRLSPSFAALKRMFNTPVRTADRSPAELILTAAGQRLRLSGAHNRAILKPRRVIKMNIVFARDQENGGRLARHEAFRIQHFFAPGKPGKGGIRFHKDVSARMIGQLALEMTVKVTLMNLPLGGAKGGIRINPHEHSTAELARAMRAYVRGLLAQKALSPEIDVPAPDVGTTPDLMAVFADEYLRGLVIRGELAHPILTEVARVTNRERNLSPSEIAIQDRDDYPGAGTATPYLDAVIDLVEKKELPGHLLSVVTGKPVAKGGIDGRVEATGRGVAVVTREAVKKYMGRDVTGVKIALQGFGNVGYHTARILESMGAIIVAVGEWDGTVLNERGIDLAALKRHMVTNRGGVSGFDHDGSVVTAAKDAWLVDGADVVIPAAREDVLTVDNISLLPASAKLIVEAANGPLTAGAEKELSQSRPDVRVIPDGLANAGGVFVSHMEMRNDDGTVKDASEQAVNADLEKNILIAARALFSAAEKEGLTLREAMGHIVMGRLSKENVARARTYNLLPELLFGITAVAMTLFTPTHLHFSLGVYMIAGVIVRAVWFSAFFIHALGHGTVKWIVDKNHPFDWNDAIEGASLMEFFKSILPLAPIHTPLISERRAVTTGDPSPARVRAKAIAGPLANAAAAIGLYAFALPYADAANPLIALAVYAATALHGAFAILSVSDYVSFFTGRAPFGFACGYLDYVAPRAAGADSASLVPVWMRDQIKFSTEILSDRGKQAYGFEIKARDRQGNVVLVGVKDVNPKRSELHTRLRKDIDAEIKASEQDGFLPMDDLIDYSSHLRFGTSSEPSRIETHPHQAPEELVDIYDWSDGTKPITLKKRNFQISVKHNGDNDGIRTEHEILQDNPVFSFSKEMSYKEIRQQMNRVLYHDITEGDSPVIASMLALFNTQGRFPASARLAYLMLSDTLNNSFKGLTSPHQIAKVIKKWGAVFEEEFLHHQKNLFVNKKGKWVVNREYMDSTFIRALQARIKSDPTIKKDPYLSEFSPHALDQFAQTTMFLFFEHNTERAIQTMIATALDTSTFGLSVNNTLEPKKKFWMAKGQPGGMGYNPDTGAFIVASDPGAVLGGLNERSKLLTFNDDHGEIIVLDMDKPRAPNLKIFSIAAHRELSDDEIAARWIPLAKNNYITLPSKRDGTADSVLKGDLGDLNGIMRAIEDGFDPKHRDNKKRPSNRLSSDRLNAQLVEMAQRHREWRELKLSAWLNQGNKVEDFQEERNQEADIVFIAEGPSYDIALRKKENLDKLCPGLNVQIVQGNTYMANKDNYYEKIGTGSFHIGKNTIIFGVSQSGMTFSNVEAIRDAEIMRKAGRIQDVYVLTGSWMSVLGRSIGQEFFPDSDFQGRIFSNMSGRRPSEASTIAAATDFLMTRILMEAMKALNAGVPEGSLEYMPFNMKLTAHALMRLEEQIEPLLNGGLSQITATDAGGKAVPSKINDKLLAQGQDLANHISEQMFSLFAVRIYTFFTVLFHVPIFHVIAFIITALTLVATGADSIVGSFRALPMLETVMLFGVWFVAHLADTVFYTFQDVYFTYLLRYLQNREIKDRLGARGLAIGSPHWSSLRDYFRAALLEAPAFLSLASIDGRRIEGDFMHRFKDAPRGTLILFQFDDSRESTTVATLKAGAAKMSVNQAAGVRNWKAGPHILINTLNPDATKRYKYESVAVSGESQFREDDGILKNEAFRSFHSAWFNELKLLVAGQVIAAEMAEQLTNVRIPFYIPRRDSPRTRFMERAFGLLSQIYSATALQSYSLFMQVWYRTASTTKIFEPGKGQSGLTVFTTQLVAPRPNKTGTKERNFAFITKALRDGGLDNNTPWIPEIGPLAPMYSVLYDPLDVRLAATPAQSHFTRPSEEIPAPTAPRRVKLPWGTLEGDGSMVARTPASVALIVAWMMLDTSNIYLTLAVLSVVTLIAGTYVFGKPTPSKHNRRTKLRVEQLEDRRFLNGDINSAPIDAHYDDVHVLLSDDGAMVDEAARDAAFADLVEKIFPVDGTKAAVYDENGRMIEIYVYYTVDGVDYKAVLSDFKYDGDKPVSFTFTRTTVNETGPPVVLEGRFTAHDKENRPTEAVVEDPHGGAALKFIITYPSQEEEQSADDTTAGEKIASAIFEEDISNVLPARSSSGGSADAAAQEPIAGMGSGQIFEDEGAIGIPPEAAIELLHGGAGAAAAAPMEEAPVDDLPVMETDAGVVFPIDEKSNTENQLDAPAPSIGADEPVVARLERPWNYFDALAASALVAGAAVFSRNGHKEKKAEEAKEPKVRLSFNRKKLRVQFPESSGVQVKLPNGYTLNTLTFEYNGNGYTTADGRMAAKPNTATNEIAVTSVNGDGYTFVYFDGAGSQTFDRITLNWKRSLVERVAEGPYEGPSMWKVFSITFIVAAASPFALWALSSIPFTELSTISISTDVIDAAWLRANALPILYWGGLGLGALTLLFAVREPAEKRARLSWTAWLSRLFYRGLFSAGVVGLGVAALSLEIAPLPFLTLGLWVIIGATTAGYFVPAFVSGALNVVGFFFRWMPSVRARSSYRKDFATLVGVLVIASLGYWFERIDGFIFNNTNEQRPVLSDEFANANWPKPPVQPAPERITVQPLKETLSYSFNNVSPLLYEPDANAIAVPLLAQKEGYLEIAPETGIAPADWKNPGRAFRVRGETPLLHLSRPITEANAAGLRRMVDYLSGVYEHYQRVGAYDKHLTSMKDRLIDRAEFLLKKIENYQREQELDVFGEIRVPLAAGEMGWVLPGQRPLGTATADTVLARVHSERRLTVRMAVPAGAWRHYDFMKLSPVVLFRGHERPARVINLIIEPRLDGSIVLTMSLLAQEQIFDWDDKANRPAPVDVRLDMPRRSKPVSFSSAVPATLLVRSYAQFNQRGAFPVNSTGSMGRTDFSMPESGWVQANQMVAGIGRHDRERLEALANETEAFSGEVEQYLRQLQFLVEQRIAPRAPAEARKFGDDFVQIKTLLAQFSFMDYQAPRAGVLTQTLNAQGQPVEGRPVAQVLTPQITITQRIPKNDGINIGDAVVVRRSSTGEETLGIVRQVNRQLADESRGEDQTRFQEVLIETNNLPGLWFADNEYGVEVIYAPSNITGSAQPWLKKCYDMREEAAQKLYRQPDLTRLPQLFPVRFIAPASADDLALLIHRLEDTAAALDMQALSATGMDLSFVAPEIRPTDTPEMRRLLTEANGAQRREWMTIFLQNRNISAGILERLTLDGQTDVAQMSLDYMLTQRRIVDLINLHRRLYEKDPSADMTLLARAHIIELIESGANALQTDDGATEDPLRRLSQLAGNDPNRAAAQEFLVSILSANDAAFHPDTAVAVRRILDSAFWKTYADKLALARALDGAEQKDAAELVRRAVFAHMAGHIAWAHGQPQEEATHLGPIKRWDPEIWDRLNNMSESERQDVLYLAGSPWTLADNAGAMINSERRAKALHEFGVLAGDAAQQAAQPLTVLDFSPSKMSADHIFGRLDALSRRNSYTQNVNLYARARFLLIAEENGNDSYLERREQIVTSLINNNTSVSRFLLARLVIKIDDAAFLKQLIDKDVDNILTQELMELTHGRDNDPGVTAIYQNALGKLAGAFPDSAAAEGRRRLALRATLESLTDFEVDAVADGKHELRRRLLSAGVPENVIVAAAKEEIGRRALAYAVPLAEDWSKVTIQSQTFAAAGSPLRNVESALALQNFEPAGVEHALSEGRRDHPAIFDRLSEIAERRREQIERGAERDMVGHLETWRLSLGISLGVIGFFAGFFAKIVSLGRSKAYSPNERKKRFFPKLFIWTIFTGAALLAMGPSAHAAPVNLNAPAQASANSEASTSAQRVLVNAPVVQSLGLYELSENIIEKRRDTRSGANSISVWEVTGAAHLDVVRKTLAGFDKPDYKEAVLLIASTDVMEDTLKLKSFLERGHQNRTVLIIEQNGAVDPAKAIESACANALFSEYKQSLRNKKAVIDLFAASDWQSSPTVVIDGVEMPSSAVFGSASLHWIDLIKGLVLSVPVGGDMDRSFEALRAALKHA